MIACVLEQFVESTLELFQGRIQQYSNYLCHCDCLIGIMIILYCCSCCTGLCRHSQCWITVECVVSIIFTSVAWCISSQETTEVVRLLFKTIKVRSPDVEIHTLMTDDGKHAV